MKSNIRNILLLMLFGTISACSEKTVTVSYQEYPNAFRNPMKGFREFFAPGIDRIREEYPYPYGSLTKEYMQWNMLEDDANDEVEKDYRLQQSSLERSGRYKRQSNSPGFSCMAGTLAWRKT